MTGAELERGRAGNPHERPPTILTNEQLKYIASTEFVPAGLRGNLPAILACVATGRAIGIDDMTAIRSIHIIDGSASYSAELMVLLVRRDGHSITGEVGEGSATARGRRVDNGDEMTCTWTMAMAERAKLVGKSNWIKYPESMLWARAVSQLCRMLFADCFAGATYTTEELGDENTDQHGVPAETVEAVEPGTFVDDGWFPPLPGTMPDRDKRLRTPDQARKLNVLVGQLRPEHVSTEDLWRSQFLDPDAHRDPDDGRVHWSPLRDLLTREQAHNLIDRLEKLRKSVEKNQASEAAAEEFTIPPLTDMT